jgi:hypothetical protein
MQNISSNTRASDSETSIVNFNGTEMILPFINPAVNPRESGLLNDHYLSHLLPWPKHTPHQKPAASLLTVNSIFLSSTAFYTMVTLVPKTPISLIILIFSPQ